MEARLLTKVLTCCWDGDVEFLDDGVLGGVKFFGPVADLGELFRGIFACMRTLPTSESQNKGIEVWNWPVYSMGCMKILFLEWPGLFSQTRLIRLCDGPTDKQAWISWLGEEDKVTVRPHSVQDHVGINESETTE
jgi:hypothetical protein